MNLPNGHLLQNGKYRLTHIVGQGGFGITYKGVWYTEVKGSLGTVNTEVPIAIKEYFFKDYCYRDHGSYAVKVHSETGKNLFHKFKEKLIKEARILSDVHHPHIVNVLEVFEENNTAYIVMEYISGLSLKEMMERQGILPENRVLKYIHQVGEALQFVHEKTILHLDIKPSNILIDRDDNARLIDFGVSKRYDDEQHETSTTMLTLSKGFASIEQYDNEGTQNFSPYPDVYSLGATMYNLLTGKIPTESILRATRPFPKPTELNPAISERTEETILKAMEVIPSDRYSSVREMMETLDKPDMTECYSTHANGNALPAEQGDTTLLYNQGKYPEIRDSDEEQTVLSRNEDEFIPHKKTRNRLYITLVLVMIVLIGSAITLIFMNSKPVIENPVVNASQPLIIPQDTVIMEEKETPVELTDSLPADTENHEENSRPLVQEKPEPAGNNTQNTSVAIEGTTVSNQVIESPQVSTIQVDATYTAFIASGNERMDTGDYAGALDYYSKANEIKPTDDISSLIKDLKVRIEEKRLNELYDSRQFTLGDLTVVRNRFTQKWGAINSEGKEVIPCQYEYADKSGENRAFGREDGLNDIYDENGNLIVKGVENY